MLMTPCSQRGLLLALSPLDTVQPTVLDYALPVGKRSLNSEADAAEQEWTTAALHALCVAQTLAETRGSVFTDDYGLFFENKKPFPYFSMFRSAQVYSFRCTELP